ncbi:MAG: ATP-binding cassette domain-containing protein [Pseudomonadales bacterium]|nr:ATP-binding cassette domain-containing protein [Pseudomonadales bacterium]
MSYYWLQLRRVSARLQGRLFFHEIDWTLGVDEQWAVLGANGAGKTALVQLLSGALRASSGSIEFGQGIDPAHDIGWVSFETQQQLCEDDARHDISEFMESAVDAGTTVRALLCGQAMPARAEFERVVETLGIGTLLERGIRFLSSGEMRRALIARELLARRAVLVLDNPYEGIDMATRAIVRTLLEERLAGSTHVLLLTRRPQDIPAAISHVLLLDHGKVLDQGRRADVLCGPHAIRLFGPAADPDREAPLPPPLTPGAGEIDGPLLELHDVHAHYGDNEVLEGINLRLDPGEHLCIAGPNGCGKSTLLALIAGDNPRAYGQQIRLFGKLRGSGESVWEIKRLFGIVSNQLHLSYPKRSRVFDVVASGYFDTLGLYETCGPLQAQGVHAWLGVLGLADRAEARFDTLSFGEQRLVLIARAMVKSPRILILDEPCSGLDEANRRRVLRLIDRIGHESATQLLFVSHEAEEMPSCITRRLEFRRDARGRFRLETLA